MNLSTEDTIVAITTPPGRGGVGMIRLSGPRAWAIGAQLFLYRKVPTKPRPHQMYYGAITDAQGNPLDDGLIVHMRRPHSYTGDDAVELHGHGAPLILQRVVEAALSLGARGAEPGEMTLRAFLHGKLDLAQAEAVADLIAANSDAAAHQALGMLGGNLSERVRSARDAIVRALVPIEATIDFPEEEVPIPQRADLRAAVVEAQTVVADLLAEADRGRVAREGVRCVIIGRPNVGKSSLLNALLRADRAIVTPIAGTTRDTVEETAIIGGVACHLIDTAGITTTDNPIEQIGVERSRAALQHADLMLLTLDRSTPFSEADQTIIRMIPSIGAPQQRLIIILNKADLAPAISIDEIHAATQTFGVTGEAPIVETSLLANTGIDQLETTIARVALGSADNESAGLVARARHREALRQAGDDLAAAYITLGEQVPLDLAAEDLRAALNALGTITGETVTEDLLSSIFSEFCIGK